MRSSHSSFMNMLILTLSRFPWNTIVWRGGGGGIPFSFVDHNFTSLWWLCEHTSRYSLTLLRGNMFVKAVMNAFFAWEKIHLLIYLYICLYPFFSLMVHCSTTALLLSIITFVITTFDIIRMPLELPHFFLPFMWLLLRQASFQQFRETWIFLKIWSNNLHHEDSPKNGLKKKKERMLAPFRIRKKMYTEIFRYFGLFFLRIPEGCSPSELTAKNCSLGLNW